jgi:predicted enzyme involved in methoxymalonyl-ACP biosynthesis
VKGTSKLYRVIYYKDSNGNQPVKKFIDELGNKTDKNSQLNFSKTIDYIKALRMYGKSLGEP